MNIKKVDFLNDLFKTVMFLKSNLKENSTIKKLSFYTPGKIDDEYAFEKNFTAFDEIIDYFQDVDYNIVEKITMVLSENEILKTIHCDKNNKMVVITDNIKKESSNLDYKKEDIDNIIKDDGCTYYEFEFGQIGKYDPNKVSYYLYKNGNWELSSSVMRWIEDPSYDYKILRESPKIQR